MRKKSPEENSLPFSERIAISYLRKIYLPKARTLDKYGLFVLSSKERQQLRKLSIYYLSWCAALGFLSALIAVLATHAAQLWIDAHDQSAQILYWLFVGGTTLLATGLEIFFIYKLSIRAIKKLSKITGVVLFAENNLKNTVTHFLVKAALESPNPRKNDFFVDPYKESSKTKILLASLFYKGKIVITNLVLKLLIRRVIGRAVARIWLEYIALPVSAFWNAFVGYTVLRQLQIRAMGASIIFNLIRSYKKYELLKEDHFRINILRAIACCVVSAQDLHPNLLYFMQLVARKLRCDYEHLTLDDPEILIENLKICEQTQQFFLLKVLVIAIIIDGKISKREVKLLRQMADAVGMEVNKAALESLKVNFIKGYSIEEHRWAEIFKVKKINTKPKN